MSHLRGPRRQNVLTWSVFLCFCLAIKANCLPFLWIGCFSAKSYLKFLALFFSFFVGWEMGYWTAKWPGARWQVAGGKWQVAGGSFLTAEPHRIRSCEWHGSLVCSLNAPRPDFCPTGCVLGGWVLQKLFWVFCSFFSMAVCACWVYKYALFCSERKHSPVGPFVDCTSGGHNN